MINILVVRKFIISFFILIFGTGICNAASVPVLNFSDLVSGPDVGLGDGKGSGAIVTVWGQNLGSAQGSSKLVFVDSTGKEFLPAYIYYWKNADGTLPGGPANLYASHKMQEIAFSIPDTALGVAQIFVRVNNQKSNVLPFTVTNVGNIYWVAPSGNNKNVCSFSAPCKYINADVNSGQRGGLANERLSAGDIVYSRGVAEPELCSGGRCIGLFVRAATGTKDNLISFIAYPNTAPTVVARDQGMNIYKSSYISLSKFNITVGHVDPSLPPNPGNSITSEFHIQTSKGRYTGNYLGQNNGTCITGWEGSIISAGTNGENVKVFGNEISGLGCPNTSRFQHTTYMSMRCSSCVMNEAWDFSYNYLHDNFAMFGIHFYDEQISSGDCGSLFGTFRITNNVILNQWGPGINLQTKDTVAPSNICWSADIVIENNILVNTGIGNTLDDNVTPPPNAIRIMGNMAPNKITIQNNTFYHWGNAKTLLENGGGQAITLDLKAFPGVNTIIKIENNIFETNIDYPFTTVKEVISSSTNNLFHSTLSSPSNTTVPAWTNNILADPKITFNNSILNIAPTSAARDAGVSSDFPVDIYGSTRAVTDIGAVEYFLDKSPPKPPTSIQLIKK